MNADDREIHEELELHLELLTEQLAQEGLAPAAAAAEAQRRFGDLDHLRAECAEVRSRSLAHVRGRAAAFADSRRAYELLLLGAVGWNLVWPMVDRDWVHNSWWAVLGICALAAGSGPELARTLAGSAGGSRSPVPWRVLAGLAVVGLLPSFHAAVTADAWPEGRVPARTVWDVVGGDVDAGWADVAPVRPLAQVIGFGFGGPTPDLMVPSAPAGSRSSWLDEQVARGLGSPPRWVTVPMASLFHACVAWTLLCGLLLVIRRLRPAPGGAAFASPSLLLLIVPLATAPLLQPAAGTAHVGEVASDAARGLGDLLAWTVFLSWFVLPPLMAVRILARRRAPHDLARALPLFLVVLPQAMGAFDRRSGFWSNEPHLVRAVGPALLVAAASTLLLARSGPVGPTSRASR